MPVDALLQRSQLKDCVEIQRLGFADFAADTNRPRRSLEVARQLGGLIFAGAEFVEVVIAGDDVLGRQRLLADVIGRLGDAIELGTRARGKRRGQCAQRGGSGPQEMTPVQIHVLRGHFGIAQLHIVNPLVFYANYRARTQQCDHGMRCFLEEEPCHYPRMKN